MKAVLTRAVAGMLLAILALAGFDSHLVVCIGSDGHIGLEPAVEGKCHGEASGTHQGCSGDRGDSAYVASCNECCYQCIDIPLPSLPAADSRITRRTPLPRETLPAMLSHAHRVPSLGAAASRPRAGPAENSASSCPDTTVVLRI